MTQEAALPPPEFVEMVRDALAHLYEPAHLVRHPLNALLEDALPPLGDPSQSLRLFVLDAIERLQPAGAERSSEKARRPYTVLVQRYVAGLAVDAIVARLQIGPRQFRREHQKGLEALAAYLWPLCRGYGETARDDSGASLMTEVEALGIEARSVSLSELLAATGAPAETLARHYGVALDMSTDAGDLRCLCDRTLAKQAVLSALSLLLAHRPRYVSLAAAGAKRDPRIDMAVRPPLPPAAAAELDGQLLEARALMAAQGGGAGLTKGAGGDVEGLGLSFRPESIAHVLVVDDNEKMLRLYERYLMIGRYSVTCAASAREAEALLEATTPDAIVLDVMMREVDGWELLQRLRSRPALASVPIVVVSILNEPAMAQALGAAAYLRKPIAAEALLAALGRALGASNRVGPRPAAP